MGIIRNDIINLVPKNTKRVLSVGCGTGETEHVLKNKGVTEIVGIEINENIVDKAKLNFDRVIIGNAEEIILPYREGYFDCIIYADLLEHLKDPGAVLLNHKRYLADDGVIIVSIPNIKYYYIILNLLLGNWAYHERGILDRSHLRFFTLKSIKTMFNNTGYVIQKIKRNYRLVEQPIGLLNSSLLARLLAKINYFYLLREFFTFQYLITASKKI